MSRILAIDYGKKRTGLAVTDVCQLIANGLTTVATHELVDFVVNYVTREDVETVVIGMPVQMNGQPSENQARVTQFIQKLEAKLPKTLNIVQWDERFTSVLAHQAILQSGVSKMRRQKDKGLVDEISACIILQSYMDSKQFGAAGL